MLPTSQMLQGLLDSLDIVKSCSWVQLIMQQLICIQDVHFDQPFAAVYVLQLSPSENFMDLCAWQAFNVRDILYTKRHPLSKAVEAKCGGRCTFLSKS